MHRSTMIPFVRSGFILAVVLCTALQPVPLQAAPNVTDANLRGLQIGAVTTITLSGSDLLPNPVVVAPFPIAIQKVLPEAKADRVVMEVQVAPEAIPGIYQIRVASGKGISNPIMVGLDRLPQLPFASEVQQLPAALHGRLTGTQILTTRFRGTKGQKIVADVEAQRLGGQLKPIVRILDSRGRQIAWSPNLSRIDGDARAEVQLPADDQYTVELHDLLFRGAPLGFFRLKLGELTFADLTFPLGVQAGTKSPLRFSSSNLPAETVVELDATSIAFPMQLGALVPPLPSFSGQQPHVLVTQHPEVAETPVEAGKRQTLPGAPIAVSGRLEKPQEEDQFIFPAKPGSRLRINVISQSIGSPVDGVLMIRNEAGNQLATNDDRPGNPDPGLEMQVPENTEQLVVAVKDLLARGGSDFIYRIEILDAAAPDFAVTADTDRLNIPVEATQALRVQVNRTNYNGKIKLAFQGLPPNVQVTGDEILEGANVGLVTLTAAAGSPTSNLVRLRAQGSVADSPPISRLVRGPESGPTKRFPWLRNDIAVAVTEPVPVRIAWTGPIESPMFLGEKLPLTVSFTRVEGATNSVRLRLMTTQVMPRKTIKENNQNKEVDDVDRALRLDGEMMVAADAKQATANVIVPADLPATEWGLVIAADILAADNKTVLATTTTTAVSKKAVVPFSVELASASDVEAKAGMGDTGKLVGKVRRQPGFTKPLVLTLAGLPKEYTAPQATVAPDREDFEFPIRFPYGNKPGELKDIKLVAQYQSDPKNAELVIRSSPVSLGVIKVVPGEPPPAAQKLAIFEDDEKLISFLTKGGGQITLETQDKHTGAASVKVTPDQRYNEEVPSLNVKIRENPGPGEYRFLRFAWKKKGGAAICLQLNHDGAWGVGGSGKPGAKFRYHAGSGGECYGASVLVDEKLPEAFVVVTRDLFADFGEFTLTGLALSPVDGEFALFDHLYLARAQSDLDPPKAAK